MHCLAHSRNDVGKDKAENITDDQSAQNIRDKVHAAEQALAADPAVQPHCQQQAQTVDENGSCNRILECEQVGVQDTFIRKQVDIISQSHEIKGTIAAVVGEAVNCTGNQRQGVKQEEQNDNRNGHCQIGSIVAAQCFSFAHDAFSSSYFCTFAIRSRLYRFHSLSKRFRNLAVESLLSSMR